MAKKKATAKKVSRARTPPWPAYQAWSTSKFWSFIRSGLRSTYNKYPPKWNVINTAKRVYKGQDKRQKWEYKCAICEQWHKQSDISVDHIVPCGALNCFDDLPDFVKRLFCAEDGLRVLCNSCHKEITNEQRTSTKN